MANSAARYGIPSSSAPLRQVQEIQFGLFSAQESERLAVIDIEYPETMYVETYFIILSTTVI